MTLALYHHTCQHGAESIDAGGGWLMPHPQPVLGGLLLLWATSVQHPARAEHLGLTHRLTSCNRLAHTYLLTDPTSVVHWSQFRLGLTRPQVVTLEAAPGARPMLWWVTTQPQLAAKVR